MSQFPLSLLGLGLLLQVGLAFPAISASADGIAPARKQELVYLLRQDCGSCHGLLLKGGLGPALLPQNLHGKSVDFLAATILNGRPGTAMPPWRPMMTEPEAHWLAQILSRGEVP